MGASNVAAVFVAHPTLPHRSKVALLFMANVSLDASDSKGRLARRYFGGPEPLAHALAGVVTDSTLRQVRKVLTELVEAGAIRRVSVGRRGHRSEYELLLDPVLAVADAGHITNRSAGLEDRSGPSLEDRSGPISGTVTVLDTDRSGPPQEQETNSGVLGGTTSPPEVPHQRAKPAGRDDEYEAAHKTLMAHGPRAHDLVAQILSTYPDTSTRDAAVQAARTLKETA